MDRTKNRRVYPLALDHVTLPFCNPTVIPADLTNATLNAWCDDPATRITRGRRKGQHKFYLAIPTAKQWYVIKRFHTNAIGIFRCMPRRAGTHQYDSTDSDQLFMLSTTEGVLISYAAYSALGSIGLRTTITTPMPGDPAYSADLLLRGLLPRALGDDFKIVVDSFCVPYLKRGMILRHRSYRTNPEHSPGAIGVVPVAALNAAYRAGEKELMVDMCPFPGFPRGGQSRPNKYYHVPALDDVPIGIMLSREAPHATSVQHGIPLPDGEGVGVYRPDLGAIKVMRDALREPQIDVDGWAPVPLMLPMLFASAWESRHVPRPGSYALKSTFKHQLVKDPTRVTGRLDVIENEIHEILREVPDFDQRRAWRYVCTRLKQEYHNLASQGLGGPWANDTGWKYFHHKYNVEELRRGAVMQVPR